MEVNNWAIIQAQEEIELALQFEKRQGLKLSFLTTSANSYFSLKQRKLAVTSIHEFLSTDQYNDMSKQNHARVNTLTRNLDSFIHELNNELPNSFLPFEAFEAELKKFVDSCSFYSIQLSQFCKLKQPTNIYYWTKISKDNPTSLNIFEQNEKIIPHLLADNWWKSQGVSMNRFVLSQNFNPKPSNNVLRETIKKSINPNLRELLKFLGFPTKPKFSSKSPRIAIVGKCDNLFEFIKSMRNKHDLKFDWWKNFNHNPVSTDNLLPINIAATKPMINDINGLHEELLSQTILCDHNYTMNYLPISELISQKIAGYWVPNKNDLLSLYLKAYRYFQTYKITAALAGTSDTYTTQIVRQAAQAKHVPFISFQHGGAYGYVETKWIELSDLRADYYAGFGSMGCSYLNTVSANSNRKTKALALGWNHGQKISQKPLTSSSYAQNNSNMSKPFKILYIPTGLQGNMRYGPNHSLDDTQYCLNQVMIIETILQIKNVKLTVKIHPKDIGTNPIPKWINQKNNSRLIIQTRGKLSETLDSSDLALLDLPTTSLIEILATGTPLIFLDFGIMKWTPESEMLFKKNNPWIDMKSGWQDKLIEETIKSLHPQKTLDPNNNPFLKAYASLDFQPTKFWSEIHPKTN